MVVTTKTTCIPINSVNLGEGDKTFLPKNICIKINKIPHDVCPKIFYPNFLVVGSNVLVPDLLHL